MEGVETTSLLFQKTSQRIYYFGQNEKTILLFWVGRDYEFTENGGVGIWNPDTAITFLYRKQRLDELKAFLAEQTTEVTEYDEGLVRQLIEKITVYDDHVSFEFKSGLETEVQSKRSHHAGAPSGASFLLK